MNRFEQKRILRVLYQLLAGLAAGTLLFFPLFSLLEYFLYLSPAVKETILIGYSGTIAFLLGYFIVRPWWQLRNTKSLPQFETLSRRISGQVLSVDDKLINYLQLLALSLRGENNRLISLSLGQKQEVIQRLDIPGKIQVSIPASVWKKVLPLAAIGLLVFIGFFDFVKEGSTRLMQANKQFVPPAPFELKMASVPERIISTQSLIIKAEAKGPALPSQVYVKLGNRTIKMVREKGGTFSQKIDNLEAGSFELSVFSGTISSEPAQLDVLPPGHIRNLKIRVIPPAYTGRQAMVQENEGNLDVVKGSQIQWELETEHLLSATMALGKTSPVSFEKQDENVFSASTKALQSTDYQINARNVLGQMDQQFNYAISVTEDEFPKIQVRSFQDSVSLSKQYYAGRIADDYGFSRLKAVIQDPKTKQTIMETTVPFSSREKSQTFVFTPEGKMASVIQQRPVVLFFKVWDNDGVAGPKAAVSQIFDVKDASKEAMAESMDRLDEKNEDKMEELSKKTESLEKNTKKMLENLKGKKELNWQDKKELENYVEKQKDLFKQIEDLKKEAEKALKNKEDNQLQSQEMLEKQEQINKMLDELLDEKTKEMLKELERLLEQQNQNKDQLQDAFEKMQDKNEFIQNELDRAMEMLKQLKVEEKLNKAIENVEKLAEKENKAGEENEKAGDKQSEEQKEKAKEEQKEMNEMFKQVQEDLKQMEELNKELKDKNDIDSGEEEQKEIEKEQKESSDQMKEGKMQKAGSKQKKAAQKMKKMAEKMKKSQMEMEGGGGDQEDIGDLRSIIENLLHLSFDQEDVYKQVSRVSQLDPKYLALTQKQVKIKDDSEIIKDSLKALAMRAPQIQSFVMKELFAMDAAIEEAVTYVKARRPDIASAKGQMAMTNINNLTVMLKDALQQMQQQQNQSQGGSKSCKKPGKGKPKPGGMSQMQKQLNDQISQLKSGKKPGDGKQMSQELAKLAQKQAAMRRALSELEKSMEKGKNKSGGLGDVKSEMEKTERELLNKKITPETIMRQQQILTRLLESEKAMMQREQDQRREAEKPKSAERTTLPTDLKELLQKAKSQKEQLLQGTPKLTEMYQDAYDKYFESIQDNGL